LKAPAIRKRHAAAKPRAIPGGQGAKAAEVAGRVSAVSPAVRRLPAKWNWHHRVLLSLQQRLLRERGESLHAAAEPLEPHSLDEADSATDEFDHNLALAQLSAEQDALYEVDAALHRIAAGAYGICEASDTPIPAARLRAIPWTRFTREVEERLEKSGAVGRARLRKAATVRESGQLWLVPEEDAEETSESPTTHPNDETLSQVFSPPGKPVAPHKPVRRPRAGQKRKDGST
jgi:RNA polymerase-binding transcription factor DksA